MVDISSTLRTAGRNADDPEMPTHKHARKALEEHKRVGMDLAVKARIAALSATAVLLVFLNPNWDVLWYHGLLFCLVLIGLAQRRVGRVGQSKARRYRRRRPADQHCPQNRRPHRSRPGNRPRW